MGLEEGNSPDSVSLQRTLSGIQYLILLTAFKDIIKQAKKKREMKFKFIHMGVFHWMC